MTPVIKENKWHEKYEKGKSQLSIDFYDNK